MRSSCRLCALPFRLALVLARNAWPLITSHEVMENVWETIEYFGNTLLFMLAGLIVGNVIYVRVDVIHAVDYVHLVLFYVVMTFIRFFIADFFIDLRPDLVAYENAAIESMVCERSETARASQGV